MHLPGPPYLLASLAVSFFLSLLPLGKYALYPFKLFTTWVHECCHAIMAVLMGGEVKKITLSKDTSGLTHYQLPGGRIRQSLVLSAGYLGSSLVGCLLYRLSVHGKGDYSHIFMVMGAVMIFSLVIWIRNLFGAFAVLAMGCALIGIGKYPVPYRLEAFFFSFIAIQTGLNALFDIRTLFSVEAGSSSDASAMESQLLLPAWFWAFLWLGLSGAMVAWALGIPVPLPHFHVSWT